MAVPTRNNPPKMSAGDLHAHLERVRLTAGELTGRAVVDIARDIRDPLHPRYFSKSESTLAEEKRVDMANEDIRSIKIFFTAPGKRPAEVNAYTSVKVGTRQAYEPTREVVQTPAMLSITLQMMDREWKTFQARYGHLKEFADLIRASLP